MKTTPNGYSYTLGHKITLNANYEGGKNTTIYTLTNGSMSELEEIKRDRYEFKGWNTKSDGTGETITSKSTLTVATTLYAQWVKIENKVNVATITNGTVVVDKTKAGVDETVTITITPAEGYELSTLKVVDAANKELTLTDNKFVMPNSEVTVTATFTKLETTVTLPSVDITEEVEEVVVGVQESEVTEEVLLESLEETLKVEGNEELAEAVTKENTVVVVEVEALETEKVEETVAKEMEKAAGKATIATYFDIMVAVRNAEKELLGTVPELTKEIELVVLLPEELKNADKTIKRDYYIIRQHDEEIKKIPATLSEDGNYLIFKSNKFSTYALAYEDTTNPQTFDGVNLYVVLGGLALISIIGIAVFTKKNKVFN